MARPIGAKTQKQGKTIFFTTGENTQIAIHRDTTGHWSYQIYYYGNLNETKRRATLSEVAAIVGYQAEEDLSNFRKLFGIHTKQIIDVVRRKAKPRGT